MDKWYFTSRTSPHLRGMSAPVATCGDNLSRPSRHSRRVLPALPRYLRVRWAAGSVKFLWFGRWFQTEILSSSSYRPKVGRRSFKFFLMGSYPESCRATLYRTKNLTGVELGCAVFRAPEAYQGNPRLATDLDGRGEWRP